MPSSTAIASSVPSRTERRRARNRDALLLAARRLFARDGFEATTIAGIAEAADLGFGTFYRYFPDKDAILDDVLDIARVELEEALTQGEDETAAPSEELVSLTTRFAGAVRRNHDLLALAWQVGVRSESGGARIPPDRLPRARRTPPLLLAGAIRRIIERGIGAGEFAAVDPELSSRFLATAHMYLFNPAALAVDERVLIKELCDLELRALSAPKEQRARRAGKGAS